MAKSLFAWLNTTPRPITAERLKSTIQACYREAHFREGQILTVTADGWYEHDFSVTKDGKTTNGTAIVLLAKDENGNDEMMSINLFVKVVRMDINGEEIVLDPNECETRTQVGEKYTPKTGDTLVVMSKNYQSMRNFPAKMFVVKFPTRNN